jgi:polyhydroxyalkanoate synthesis regulator phasin
MQAFFAAVLAKFMENIIYALGRWLRKMAVKGVAAVVDKKETKKYDEVVQNPEATRDERKKAEDDMFNNN